MKTMQQDFDETNLRLLGVLYNAGCPLLFSAIHLQTNPCKDQNEIVDRLSILADKTGFVEISLKKEEAGLTALGRQYLRENRQPVGPGYWQRKKAQ